MAAKQAKPSPKTVKAKAITRKPPLEFDVLHDRGKKTIALVDQNPLVKERLEPGLLPNLESDLGLLLGQRQASINIKDAARLSTIAQDKLVVNLHKSVSAIRIGVEKFTKDKELRAAYGLNTKLQAGSVTLVTAAGLKIVARARANTDEARAIGILDRDVTNLEELIIAVELADEEQKTLKADKPLTIRERNEAGNRVWKAIVSIASKGIMAFPLDEELRARFDVLDDLPKKVVKKKAA